MAKKRGTQHLRRLRPAASRPHRTHKLPYLPGCRYSEDPSLLESAADKLKSVVDFVGLQGYQPEGIIEIARIALDICVAGLPDPSGARRDLAELVCQSANCEQLCAYSESGRIYTSLICDADWARTLSEAVTANAPPKSIPDHFEWALSGADSGVAMLTAARVLIGALDAVLERIEPGSSRAFLDALRDDLSGGRTVRDHPDVPDLWTAAGDDT